MPGREWQAVGVRTIPPAIYIIMALLLASCATGPVTEAPPASVPVEPVSPAVRSEPASPEASTESAAPAVPAAPADSSAPAALAASAAPASPASPGAWQPVPVEEPPTSRRDPDAEARSILAAYETVPVLREISLRLFPGDATVSVLDGAGLRPLEAVRKEKDRVFYTSEATAVLVSAEGYISLVLPLEKDGTVEAKLERFPGILRKKGETGTLWQPKSVQFMPDGESLFVANLGSEIAMSRYRTDPPELMRHFQVPVSYRDAAGFVETAILPGRGEIWLSQMTTNTVHVFNLATGAHLQAIGISGGWPKVLLADDEEKKVYVSCWETSTIVEIDAATRKEVRSLTTGAAPRGLAFADDGRQLLVALFGSSAVDRIDLATGERKALHDAAPGRIYAMRHIVHDTERREYYVTAMGMGRVYRLDEDGNWNGWWEVGSKPNTCRISPDGSRLFVSCRGPNNPDTGYLTRGYEYGKIYIINLETSEVEGWIWGRDQCTGLDVSPDGRLLAFSNFLTPSLEIYEILGD